MPTEPSNAEPPKRRRRWFQFSLRSLLIFIVVVAIPCAWFGRKIERKGQEREAAAAITKLGGLVFYDYQLSSSTTKVPTGIPPGPDWLRHLLGENFFSEVLGVILNKRSTVSDSDLVNLSGLRGLTFLMLSDANITDAGLVNLNGLVQLRTLDLSRTKISDDGLVHVKRLTNLKSLDLNQTAVGGAGLAHLAGLTSLEKLDLRETNVTNAGLVHLEGLAQLKELDLLGTKVSDPGLACLKRLTSLRTLHLELTNVTRVGIEDLQNTLPNCEIIFWHSDQPFRPNRSE